MKICYLIIAHKNPEQLHRLISRLNHKDVSFFIHINKLEEDMHRSSIRYLSDLPNVHFTRRYKVWWGTFSILKAILSGMQEIIKSDIKYERAILLSGQDYPIKSNQYIHEFFDKNSDKNFIDYFALNAKNIWMHDEGQFNVERRTDLFFGYRSRGFFLPVKRKIPYGYVGYGCIAWWSLTRECVEYIAGFIENNKKFMDFIRHTYLPEEIFFSTLLANSPLRHTLVNKTLRHINIPSTELLTLKDFQSLEASPDLFARKFDVNIDTVILDEIDQKLLQSDQQVECFRGVQGFSRRNNIKDSFAGKI